MTRPNGQVVALSVRDGCPYLDDVGGNEINNDTSAAPALADSAIVDLGKRNHD